MLPPSQSSSRVPAFHFHPCYSLSVPADRGRLCRPEASPLVERCQPTSHFCETLLRNDAEFRGSRSLELPVNPQSTLALSSSSTVVNPYGRAAHWAHDRHHSGPHTLADKRRLLDHTNVASPPSPVSQHPSSCRYPRYPREQANRVARCVRSIKRLRSYPRRRPNVRVFLPRVNSIPCSESAL